LQQVYPDLATITDILGKLKKRIWRTLCNWNKDRVHAKILLIEVRNLQGHYESETYSIVKEYCQLIKLLIEKGIKNGEIRKGVSPWFVMQIILGNIEHVVLPSLLFDISKAEFLD
jgi:hypothetical protein